MSASVQVVEVVGPTTLCRAITLRQGYSSGASLINLEKPYATVAAFITEKSVDAGSWIPSSRTNGHCRIMGGIKCYMQRQSPRERERRGELSTLP